ncbi:hypothetical protein J2S22_002174 [Rhodoplanes tepidamans]|nr:hypothetical protein [Rhodoplanes tepidamans]
MRPRPSPFEAGAFPEHLSVTERVEVMGRWYQFLASQAKARMTQVLPPWA